MGEGRGRERGSDPRGGREMKIRLALRGGRGEAGAGVSLAAADWAGAEGVRVRVTPASRHEGARAGAWPQPAQSTVARARPHPPLSLQQQVLKRVHQTAQRGDQLESWRLKRVEKIVGERECWRL